MDERQNKLSLTIGTPGLLLQLLGSGFSDDPGTSMAIFVLGTALLMIGLFFYSAIGPAFEIQRQLFASCRGHALRRLWQVFS